MVETGFDTIVTYIPMMQNTVARYIATRPILDMSGPLRDRGRGCPRGGGNRTV